MCPKYEYCPEKTQGMTQPGFFPNNSNKENEQAHYGAQITDKK
jgi:hypothetical protein